MQSITTIEDLKSLYQKRVPRMFYDYAESGSWTEKTFRANSTDFQDIYLRQRVAIDMSARTTQTTMIGQDVSMPVALAPVGLIGMQNADGEIKAASAAEKFGVLFTLSTMSICSIEDVRAHTKKPFMFQLYVMRDQDYMRRLIERARQAECSALVLTVDLQILGQRHKDLKNGLGVPPKPTLQNWINLATKWRWSMEMLQTKRRSFGNIVGHIGTQAKPENLTTWVSEQFEPKLDWSAVEKIRDQWGGKFVIKGIMEPEDAVIAAKMGVDAIVVSNHGGRQLDGTISSIRALDPVLQAVGDKVEVLIDGGIRSGQDVLKAVAMGARGTFVGRSFVYGLGAMGEAGVEAALKTIHKELDMSMALCGHRDINAVDRDIIRIPRDFSGDWETR